jgi:ankyrin repeat protein
MVAVLSGNLDMVRLLLWKDADVDIKNDAGWTALHEAAKNSTLEIFDALLDKGYHHFTFF